MKITIDQSSGLVEVYKDGVKTKEKYDNIFKAHVCTSSKDTCLYGMEHLAVVGMKPYQ